MSPVDNDIFKFISLRSPMDGLTITPTEDVLNCQVFKLVENTREKEKQFDPENPSQKVLDSLANFQVLSELELENSLLSKIYKLLEPKHNLTFSKVNPLQFNLNGSKVSLAEVSASEQFNNDYRDLTNSWLVLNLKKEKVGLREKHEYLIRAAHICWRLRTSPNSLKEPGVLSLLLQARIIYPKEWRPYWYEQQKLLERHKKTAKQDKKTKSSKLSAQIKQKKNEFLKQEKRIEILESIHSKAYKTYLKFKKEKVDDEDNPSNSTVLNENYYSQLKKQLTDEEQEVYVEAIGENGESRYPVMDRLTNHLNVQTTSTIKSANEACADIRVWELEEKKKLPTGSSAVRSKEGASIRNLGFGDLVVARERLIGYDAREIAHIENVLSGEKKVREHERTKTTEQIAETETFEETETERDLQTSDRYELQNQSQKTLDQDFSFDTEVNTSGRYGLTKVDTSTQVGLAQSRSESRNSSINLAKEIVSRAVDRTFESVRKLHRLTITEQIRELNTHSIDNVGHDGNENPPSHSGIYLWVEKIHEIELRQYGKRLMIEINIPEPAVSLLEQGNPKENNIPKPAPLTVGPTDITAARYLCLTKLYGAENVEPPPPLFVNSGLAWASVPDENLNENKAEEAESKYVEIPPGYAPISCSVKANAEGTTTTEEHFRVFVAVGGKILINGYAKDEEIEEEWNGLSPVGDESFDSPVGWYEKGVPVSITAHGHYDKSMVVHIVIKCERTKEAMAKWQLETWEKIRQAHQVLVREYENTVQEQAFSDASLFQIQGRPEAENRRIEQEELKKWAIRLMRPQSFDFDAVDPAVGDFQEIIPEKADFQAPIVQFFEEAFEWRQMTYFLYPYFWGRRDAWKLRMGIDHNDPRHEAFLRAGSARLIVPVTLGYEERVKGYIDADLDRSIERSIITQQNKLDKNADDLWVEILVNKNEDLALGSGTLNVKQGDNLVTINDNSRWGDSDVKNGGYPLTDRDLGREIFIGGDRYYINSLVEEDRRQFKLNEPYKGDDDEDARYATGSVPYGSPWLVRIPTSLVILQEEKEKLEELSKQEDV